MARDAREVEEAAGRDEEAERKYPQN